MGVEVSSLGVGLGVGVGVGVAVGVGLLGSVVSFCVAFGSFKHSGFDVERITAGLTTAYTTTAVGLVTSLIASLGSWALNVAVRR